MRRQTRWIVFALVAALAASACGGDGDDGPDVSGDTIAPISDDPTTSTTAAAADDPPPDEPEVDRPDLDEDAVVSVDDGAAPGEVRALVRSIDVGETAHYAGFTIEVATVEIGFDPAGFAVAEIRVALTNRTPRDERLQTLVEIESAGVVSSFDRDNTPVVPAGGTSEGFFSLRLDRSFTFADAVLAIGRADRQRVTIPLGDAGELVTRVPEVYESPGAAEAGGTSVEVTRVGVGWDMTDPRGQAEPGQRFVSVDYILDSAVATAVNDDTVLLADGSGAEWAPTTATVQAVDAGEATALHATFELTEPVRDDLVLRYIERFGNGEIDVSLSLG